MSPVLNQLFYNHNVRDQKEKVIKSNQTLTLLFILQKCYKHDFKFLTQLPRLLVHPIHICEKRMRGFSKR